jgi:outer membrane protein
MKRCLRTIFASLCALLLIGGVTSCGGNNAADKNGKAPVANSKNNTDKSGLPNYRYVDIDTVLSRYNLAKDYSEQMLRLQSNYENEGRKHQSSINTFAKSMEDKYKSNGYLSEASFNQDQQKLAGMQSSAQKSMEQLEASMQQQYMEAQKIVNDSIQKFIEVYNAQHGYDAILLKAATLYINPDLDITDEVVEGLNARYNKVKK